MDASLAKLAILAVLVAASAFFSSSEAALFGLGLYRVRRLRTSARRSYDAAQKLLREPTKLLSTLLAGNELVNAAIGVFGSSLVYSWARGRVDEALLPWLAVGTVLPFVLVLGEVIPKTLGLKNPELLASTNAIPLLWFSRAIAPVRDLLSWFAETTLSLFGVTPTNAEKISEAVFRSMVDAGTEEGVVDLHEQRLIHNVLNLEEIRVEAIMTPKSKVSHLTEGITISQALKAIERERFSRFPVLDEAGKRVVGTLYAKDLLGLPQGNAASPILPFLRPPLLVPRETTALHLFALLRSKRTHFGIVCGTFAHEMVGVVTLEDVLEEIFGELRDERDVEEGSWKSS